MGRVRNERGTGAAWWSRSRGLPEAAYKSWKASLAVQPAQPMRILAWARTSAGFCIASPATLSYGDQQGWEQSAGMRLNAAAGMPSCRS